MYINTFSKKKGVNHLPPPLEKTIHRSKCKRGAVKTPQDFDPNAPREGTLTNKMANHLRVLQEESARFIIVQAMERYHLKELSANSRSRNVKELFNLRHSSLRVTIERAFTALKNRF
jgi:hypothetical protein